MTANVGELNIKMGVSTSGVTTSMEELLRSIDPAVEKLRKKLEFEDALDNLKLKVDSVSKSMSDMGSMQSTAGFNDPFIERITSWQRAISDTETRARNLLSFGDKMGSMQSTAGFSDPFIERITSWQRAIADTEVRARNLLSFGDKMATSQYSRDPMISKLSEFQNGVDNQKKVWLASDREQWTERARMRDKDLKDQIQADNIAAMTLKNPDRFGMADGNSKKNVSIASDREQWTERARMRDKDLKDQIQAEHQNKILLASDREYWTERARMRDKDLKDQIQADKIAAMALKRPERFPNLGNTAADNNSNNKGFQGARMAQQIGFGIQDFASQVMNSKNGVDGIGRGIMAVSNNVQMLGASFGPTGLAVTAIGGAIAGIILPAVIKWAFNAEEVEKSTDRLIKQYDNLADRMESVIRIQQLGPQALVDETADIGKKADLLEKQAKAETQRTDNMRARQSALNKEFDTNVFLQQQGGRFWKVPENVVQRNKEIKSELDDLKLQLDAADKRITEKTIEAQNARAVFNKLKPDADTKRSDIEMERHNELSGLNEQKRQENAMDVARRLMDMRTGGLRPVNKNEAKIYDTDEQMSLIKRQDRELKDLQNRPEGASDAELELAKVRHNAEFERLKLRQKEDAISAMGPAAGMSAGLDVNTSAGLSAINKALGGRSEQDLAKQQLEELKKLVRAAEETVRTKAETVIVQLGF